MGKACAATLLSLFALASSVSVASVFQATAPPRAVALLDLGTDLFRLTSVTSAGDDRLFLTQQGGLVHVFANGALGPEPFLDLQGKVSTGGERGLLSLAFHPDYAHNGLFFACYTDLEGALTVARYRVSADPDRADPGSGEVVLRVPKKYQEHNGGQLQFGPDGYLYLGIGDGGSEGHVGGDPECMTQRGETLFGKMLRLDVDSAAGGHPYAIPADNPFRGSGTMPDEVWATGLRNPWRFSFDRLTGDLYIGDVGEKLREEIDFEPAGSPGGVNYGWKVMEGTACFSSAACPADTPPCGSPDYALPVLEYGHEDKRCSVTGGYVYRGTDLPHLWGAYIFGDQCNGQLWAAERKGTGWEVHELPPRALYVTAFGEDSRGEIHLTTLAGRLLRLAPAHPVDTVALYEPATARLLVKDLHRSGPQDRTVQVGSPVRGWVPLAGDWDGDGRSTVKLVAPRKSAKPGAMPLAGDWDGDGKDTVGFYERNTSTFQAGRSFRFGPPRNRWIPVTGDWDGDGRDSVGFYDPARGVFRLKNELAGGDADVVFRFGPPKAGWIPIAGDWDGDGRDGIGLYIPATSVFLLKNGFGQGPPDWEIGFGPPAAGRIPLAGEW
jgi:glucose/arabinose dehydrogenase